MPLRKVIQLYENKLNGEKCIDFVKRGYNFP